MIAEHPMGDPGDLAACYLCGAMPDAERTAFERHLSTGCAACVQEIRQLQPALESLLNGVEPLTPDPAIRQRLLARAESLTIAPSPAPAHPSATGDDVQVWRHWSADQPPATLFTKRADEGDWEPTGVEGVSVRRLFVDKERDQFTALVRMLPGAAYPRHVHNGPEECLVLEGDLHVGDEIVLHKGDYQRAPAGTRHAVQYTVGGCLLLINSSLSDEMD